MTNTKKKQRKKRKNKTKKIISLKTIYKHHEFGGSYPVIHPSKYAAIRSLDLLNLPSDLPSKQEPLRSLIIKELIRRIMIYLKRKKNRNLLKKTLKIKYNKKTIEKKLLKLTQKRSKLVAIENFYKQILLAE
mgnify:FL=1|tara:strand:- start:4560 stop:4955 length:396 start_codon:yes stop_codon:yes gene_type:complete